MRYIVAIRPPARPIDRRKMMASCSLLVFFQGHLRFTLQVTDYDDDDFVVIDWMTALWNITAARDIDNSTWSDEQDIFGNRKSQPTV